MLSMNLLFQILLEGMTSILAAILANCAVVSLDWNLEVIAYNILK